VPNSEVFKAFVVLYELSNLLIKSHWSIL